MPENIVFAVRRTLGEQPASAGKSTVTDCLKRSRRTGWSPQKGGHNRKIRSSSSIHSIPIPRPTGTKGLEKEEAEECSFAAYPRKMRRKNSCPTGHLPHYQKIIERRIIPVIHRQVQLVANKIPLLIKPLQKIVADDTVKSCR